MSNSVLTALNLLQYNGKQQNNKPKQKARVKPEHIDESACKTLQHQITQETEGHKHGVTRLTHSEGN